MNYLANKPVHKRLSGFGLVADCTWLHDFIYPNSYNSSQISNAIIELKKRSIMDIRECEENEYPLLLVRSPAV